VSQDIASSEISDCWTNPIPRSKKGNELHDEVTRDGVGYPQVSMTAISLVNGCDDGETWSCRELIWWWEGQT
jgi:hypothetical protein